MRASPGSGFLTTLYTAVRSFAAATAGASGSVLRTTALGSFTTHLHSIPVATRIRQLRRCRLPLASTLGLVVPHRMARFAFPTTVARRIATGIPGGSPLKASRSPKEPFRPGPPTPGPRTPARTPLTRPPLRHSRRPGSVPRLRISPGRLATGVPRAPPFPSTRHGTGLALQRRCLSGSRSRRPSQQFRPVPVATPIVTAPVNLSVITMIVQQLDHRARCNILRTARRLRRHRPAQAVASLRSSSALRRSASCRRSGLCPSPASASRRPLVSAPLPAPLPIPPAACFARLPSPPSAVTATQSPWRLPFAGSAGLVSPSLIPQVCRSPPHGAALVFTPHASLMLAMPLTPLACSLLRNGRLCTPRPYWIERMSNGHTPSILALAIHRYACPTPTHGRYTLDAAGNRDRYTTDMRA